MEISDSRLKYLYEAHRQGTMRAASEFFNIAPSSVSRQIAGLERELGLVLVEKGRHTVHLTEAGKLLVDYYRERVGRHEALISALDDLRGMRTGHVRVAVGQSLVNSLLATVIQRYRTEWPGIRVHVTEVATQQVLALISQDEVHFGLLLNPPSDSQLRDRFSFALPFEAVVPRDHPLADKPLVALRDLFQYPLVLPTPNFRSRQMLEDIAIKEQLTLNSAVTVSSIHMLMSCIRAGVGVGVLPNIYLNQEPGTESLVSIPIDNEALSSFTVHAMTRLGRTLPHSAQVLLDLLEREIGARRQRQRPRGTGAGS
jgi:DNA-binding transcriptional LysR family regulator